jgi:Copine
MESIKTVALSGPTLLGPILGSVRANLTANPISQERLKYTVVLVLCDGAINDVDVAISEIVELSHLPVSIIIIGVGAADFTDMHVLDGDGQKLSSHGKSAVRDIVQFVPFRDFASQSSTALAKAVLAEVPGQVLEFMAWAKFTPNSPPPPYSG